MMMAKFPFDLLSPEEKAKYPDPEFAEERAYYEKKEKEEKDLMDCLHALVEREDSICKALEGVQNALWRIVDAMGRLSNRL
jgi:hypothetical protein